MVTLLGNEMGILKDRRMKQLNRPHNTPCYEEFPKAALGAGEQALVTLLELMTDSPDAVCL